MRDRIVRTIVFFDLPNIYAKDKRNYFMISKVFIKMRVFIMMQESVYSKISIKFTINPNYFT